MYRPYILHVAVHLARQDEEEAVRLFALAEEVAAWHEGLRRHLVHDRLIEVARDRVEKGPGTGAKGWFSPGPGPGTRSQHEAVQDYFPSIFH